MQELYSNYNIITQSDLEYKQRYPINKANL